MVRSNTFEGGSNGTVLTTGNTGGASGDAASTITDPNSIQKFSSAFSAHGGLSMNITQTATAASTRWDWTALGSITTDVWFRNYLYLPALPPSGWFIFAGVRNNAGGLSSELFVDTSGHINVHNAAGGTIITGSVAVPTNTWFRVEFRVRSSTTVGEAEYWLYNTMDSTTADENLSATNQILAANTDQVRWGQVTNAIASFTSYHDDVAASDVAKLGPAVAASPAAIPIAPAHASFGPF